MGQFPVRYVKLPEATPHFKNPPHMSWRKFTTYTATEKAPCWTPWAGEDTSHQDLRQMESVGGERSVGVHITPITMVYLWFIMVYYTYNYG